MGSHLSEKNGKVKFALILLCFCPQKKNMINDFLKISSRFEPRCLGGMIEFSNNFEDKQFRRSGGVTHMHKIKNLFNNQLYLNKRRYQDIFLLLTEFLSQICFFKCWCQLPPLFTPVKATGCLVSQSLFVNKPKVGKGSIQVLALNFFMFRLGRKTNLKLNKYLHFKFVI